jgi:hypothetical protein
MAGVWDAGLLLWDVWTVRIRMCVGNVRRVMLSIRGRDAHCALILWRIVLIVSLRAIVLSARMGITRRWVILAV